MFFMRDFFSMPSQPPKTDGLERKLWKATPSIAFFLCTFLVQSLKKAVQLQSSQRNLGGRHVSDGRPPKSINGGLSGEKGRDDPPGDE